MGAYSALLTDAIRSMIELKEEKDLDSLFSGGRTTALVDTIAGLDDFELVAFLVLREPAREGAKTDGRRDAIRLAPPVLVNRVLPKNKVYANARISTRLKRRSSPTSIRSSGAPS